MNAARDFFETLDLARINQLIAEKTVETLHFDFISTSGFRRSGSNYNRENIAKPISGFSNSDGGVLIYGLDSAKDSNKRDYPTRIEEPPPKSGFKDAIRMVAAHRIAPSVLGLEIREIADASAGTLAFAVYVPRSRLRPHMSSEHKKYFRRSDDGFHEADHANVELLFRTRIVAEMNTFPLVGMPSTEGVALVGNCLRFTLANLGNSPAVNLRVLAALKTGTTVEVARRPLLAGSWRINRDGDLDPLEAKKWQGIIEKANEGAEAKLVVLYSDLAGAQYNAGIPLIPRLETGRTTLLRLSVGPEFSLTRDGQTVV